MLIGDTCNFRQRWRIMAWTKLMRVFTPDNCEFPMFKNLSSWLKVIYKIKIH